MRILHVIQELRVGGAERVVVSLARGAREAGHEVAVASAGGDLAGEIEGGRFPVGMLERRPWRVPGAARDVARAIRAWRPDVLHCHNPGMALAAGLALGRGRRLPGVVSVHGVPDTDWRTTGRLLRVAGLPVVACGPGVQAALAEHGRPPIRTIWNAVGPPPDPADRAALARHWGFPPDAPLLVAAGRLVPAKNHLLALRALAAVPGAALAILGEGPLRTELAEAARTLGLGHRVALAGLRPDAREIIGAADAVVFSSRSEGLPLVALEALAAGTPIVATAVRGLRELLDDGRTALLVPPDDASALAAALRRVLADGALAARLAEGGRRLAAEHDESRMVSEFLELYEHVVR